MHLRKKHTQLVIELVLLGFLLHDLLHLNLNVLPQVQS